MKNKYLWMVAILFFPLGITYGAMEQYPQKLGDFSSFGGFDDVYMRIYQDANEESDVHVESQSKYESEILDRVGQHNLRKRSRASDDTYTQQEIEILSSLGVIDIHKDGADPTSSEEQVFISQILRGFYQYEQQLLQFQNDLARANGLRSIFENDSNADSPFDIIKDLRILDQLIFGEKYDSQKTKEPQFLVYNGEGALSMETEDWQDQRMEALQEKGGFEKKEYSNHTNSLTGTIAGIVLKPLTKLLSYSLVGGVSTKGMFEFSAHSGTSQDTSGAGGFTHALAPPDKTQTLSEKAQEEGIASGLNIAIEQLLESNCIETDARQERKKENGSDGTKEDPYLQQFNRVGLFIRCQDSRKADFLSDLQTIREKADFLAEKSHFEDILPRILNWNKDLKSYLTSAKEIHQIFKRDFIPKPQK